MFVATAEGLPASGAPPQTSPAFSSSIATTDAIAQQNRTVADALMSAHIGVGHVAFARGFGDEPEASA